MVILDADTRAPALIARLLTDNNTTNAYRLVQPVVNCAQHSRMCADKYDMRVERA